jgi:hypothetical protein
MSGPVLTKDERGSMAGGGTVSYRVALDGRWIGWVGDERTWRGWRYSGRKWWACWREDGDTAARWNSHTYEDDCGHPTRAAALADLVAHVRGEGVAR